LSTGMTDRNSLTTSLPAGGFSAISALPMNAPPPPSYCPDLLHYSRRLAREVRVGNVGVGGENPIRVQSMITADTRDTEACVKEVLELARSGCEISGIVRTCFPTTRGSPARCGWARWGWVGRTRSACSR
jgi:hypothetical protein